MSKLVTAVQILDSLVIVAIFFIYTWYIFYYLEGGQAFFGFKILCIVTFIISAIFKMNTAYFEGPKLIMDKDKIFTMYK
jgi:hypothetical protein